MLLHKYYIIKEAVRWLPHWASLHLHTSEHWTSLVSDTQPLHLSAHRLLSNIWRSFQGSHLKQMFGGYHCPEDTRPASTSCPQGRVENSTKHQTVQRLTPASSFSLNNRFFFHTCSRLRHWTLLGWKKVFIHSATCCFNRLKATLHVLARSLNTPIPTVSVPGGGFKVSTERSLVKYDAHRSQVKSEGSWDSSWESLLDLRINWMEPVGRSWVRTRGPGRDQSHQDEGDHCQSLVLMCSDTSLFRCVSHETRRKRVICEL